jgi:cobalt-zinc-cadmium resistance protein CzcA
MLNRIINLSIKHKLIAILITISFAGFGVYAILQIPLGAVPDITNNQVQVITTSTDLSTQDVEQFITYPVELAMSNLPGVTEIRSISKFGLSVVTIVFEDRLGTYLPRQLIAEKIKTAAADIPEGFGTPEMGPISTGLGEIYQYVLDVQPGYEDDYSIMELRTIQDWLVKRQLSGIPGVVEVNTWGGFLKQYEVSVNPERLKSYGISLMDVFTAIEENNSVGGGAYIEKTNQSYFIRGDGLVTSLDDLRQIVVDNRDGIPLLVKDIADVRFGSANRFGAITANGKGETVMGQIMMLKDANSNKVIESVKERVAEVQQTLPPGIYINPIVERSELIKKTSFTVFENLLFGCLIVFFTVVILMGNFRSGLVVASIIPLSLLFTISMMYIFGIDANLMSLGALDFGIIIDGAVIIVEFIVIRLTVNKDKLEGTSGENKQNLMDSITFEGASKMISSAIFGQVIILIVFIPVLSLSGVEGKMFRPMALSFSFALLGAMFFGFTWLPVAASLFLRPEKEKPFLITRWLMRVIYRSYDPVIRWAYNHKKILLGMAVASLVLTGVIFSRMGGEFVPTLDEGDFVIQPVLKTGTSLSKTIETTTKMENILLDHFPEVEKIVSRIGAAEVPTDPMSMEEIDMIIKLKPKKEWVSADSKEELANRFKEELEVLPGIEYEFTQPIEMRFNELITGVRADLAIKIFGEDLDILAAKAEEVKELITGVPGAADIILEKTEGLPQMSVKYNRAKVAQYGLSIAELNRYLTTGFAGGVAGSVFEGERRFDLVTRLQPQYRNDIEHIRNLFVSLPNGNQVPMKELAAISYTKGPAKISRDDTKRRVVVSVNVRNRDLESVVYDIEQILNERLDLPSGYYLDYGGQFENLRNASRRLKIAVPIALLLIFIFLHFAFGSLKEAALIFTAIPLSIVGGVLLLWIRGMPFSISAGIGFIALFGVAVLNGIVLIEHLKDLKEQGITDMRERIMRGTRERLRPVLLTAAAAALGFLPMAISTSAGAEVQRPLATVVIGGLVTSTLLTMLALPVLYSIFDTVTGIQLWPPRLKRNNPEKK